MKEEIEDAREGTADGSHPGTDWVRLSHRGERTHLARGVSLHYF